MKYTVIVEAAYDADADATFESALDLSEMREAMRGLAVYQGLPQRNIVEGETIVVDVTMFGFIKTRNHIMFVERLDKESRVIQSREHNDGIKQWDHTLSVQPFNDGCVWRDKVVVDAGFGTYLTALFCRFVYARRHRVRCASSIKTKVSRSDVTNDAKT